MLLEASSCCCLRFSSFIFSGGFHPWKEAKQDVQFSLAPLRAASRARPRGRTSSTTGRLFRKCIT